ncbi:MAG: BTB/POZ domain-containing protein [Parachlamydiaceae bacterium]|nr:BTB/POZ domain-containing protein [Parachlamydiaceae bacterium]
MNISNIHKPQLGLDQLTNVPIPNSENLIKCTEVLLDIIANFPTLKTDSQANNKLCTLVDNIFSRKEHLPLDNQKAISKLFYTVHGLNPSRFEHLLEIETSAKSWIATHPDAKAIIEGKQKFPISSSILKNEEMPCKEYFKSLSVQLGDGTTVEISQGLLAHFSDMIRLMLKNKEMKDTSLIILPQLNRHQFDVLIAFLEIKNIALVNEENWLPLLYAGEYLQIPEIIEECKIFIKQNIKKLDLKQIVELLNHFGATEILSKHLENEIILTIKAGLSQQTLSNEFMANLEYLKANLKCPITLSLGRMDIENNALNHLKGLPISNLHLMQCKNLTAECLSIVAEMPTVKGLKLGNNDWVDDNALSKIPLNIKELSLTGCRRFSGKGLAALQKNKIINFELNYCNHLTDDDYFSLPTQFQKLDLRSCKGLGEKTMQRLGQMNELRHLVLANTPITGAQIKHLPLGLHTLDLIGCQVDNDACKHIGLMDELEELLLARAKIDNEGIKSLPNSIIHLSLENCPDVNDEGIASLANRNNLKFLELLRSYNLSYETIKNLPPSIKVNWQEPPLTLSLPSKAKK